ncbi:MAG: hypothetical protein IPJ40_13615 [Saprospirales bacterium]|nr:hypothetical protein [Saprospirales bacterium]
MRQLYIITILLATVWLQSCYSEKSDSIAPGDGTTGVAGSYARFMIVDDFLYVVDRESIKTYSLENPADPNYLSEQFIGSNIETIFNLGDKLFIGAGSGLYVYTIGSTGIPQAAGQFLYSEFNFGFEPCDPVVANDTYAYVTLNTTNRIQRCRVSVDEQVNLLNIFNITNVYQPFLVAQYNMYNPKGVGLDGDILFICEDSQGLKVYNVADPENIQLLKHFTGFTAFDVIPLGGLLLVVGPDNVYQFDYSNPENIIQISEIPLGT